MEVKKLDGRLQRRAYGYRDEDYLKLKLVAAFLPPLTRSAEKDPL